MIETLAALLVGLVLGIGLGETSEALRTAGSPHVLMLAAPSLAGIGLVVIGRKQIRPPFRWALIAMAVIPLACLWTLGRTPTPGRLDPVHWAPLRHAEILGTVRSDPRRNARGLRFELAVEGLVRPFPSHGSGTILVRVNTGGPDTGEPGTGELRYGQRVRLRGSLKVPPVAQNPGEFDYRDYLARQGIFAVMNARGIAPLPEAPAPSVIGGAIAFKNEALALISRNLPDEEAALLGSLLFGDGASPIDPETAEAFRALGLAHVLAVSGAQILFLWGMIRGSLTGLGIPRAWGALIGCAGLWGYAVMTGLPPSVTRATWMGCALIVGWAVDRPWLRYLVLEAVVTGMLLHRPQLLFDVGFQFSAIATFALLHTSPLLLPLFKRLPEVIAQALAMALAAGIWVLPLQIFHFGQLSPYSLPLNAVTCFMVESVTILGFLAVLGGAISELLGHHMLSGAYLVLRAFTGIVELTLPLPFASQFLRIPPAAWLVVAYLGVAGAASHLGRTTGTLPRGQAARSLCWLVLPVLAYGAWNRLDRPRDLQVTVLGIGQGDAIVLRTPAQQWYLIDGGPCWDGGDAGERTILPYLRRQGCQQLAGMILSHAHDDHVGGLAAVSEGLPVSAVWDAGQSGSSPAYRRWQAGLRSRQVPMVRVQEGMRADLEPGLSLEVVGPPAHAHRGSRSDANNNSIVLRLTYGNFRMLFTGDLEIEAEKGLLDHPERLRANVLKVAHHGSRYGSGEAFLSAVNPQASVISVGAQNSFRHPAPETLARLRPYGRVYRTDQEGAVTLRSDGRSWSLTGHRE